MGGVALVVAYSVQDPAYVTVDPVGAGRVAYAVTALLSSLILLSYALSSVDPNSSWAAMGLPQLSYGEIQCLMYLKISLSDYFSVFNSRCKGWMWTRAPSVVLVGAFILATFASTIAPGDCNR